jgi:Na+/phosphate symporter
VENSLSAVARILNHTYTNFFKEKHKELKQLRKEAKKITKNIKHIREDIPNTLKKFEESDLESGHLYVQVVTYMVEMCNSLTHIVQPAFDHLDNNHAFDKEQNGSLVEFNDQIKSFFDHLMELLKKGKYDQIDDLTDHRDKMILLINDMLYHRVKIIKKTKKGVKVSVTYIEMLSETKNLLSDAVHLVKADIKLMDVLSTDTKPKELATP